MRIRAVIARQIAQLQTRRVRLPDMGYRWIVNCKYCGAEITFQIVDEQHPREVQPPKPVMMKQALKCSLCKTIADYARQDLHCRSA